MADKIAPTVNQPPAVQTNRVRGPVTAPNQANIGAEGIAATPPASGFQPGTQGLQGKFAATPALRAGLFANTRAAGLNRATDVLGPNKFTVGELVVRFGEHLEDPASPTAHDLALMNGAFTALGQS